MKKLIFILSIAFSSLAYGQQRQSRTFLFVPGAWDGGWDYAKVDSILTTKGDKVYRPTLTGLGERVHLSNPGINLTTYVNDILNLIRFENLHDVILVGHSYGGLVISGVAEQVPDRIKELVYLDAMVPNNGESAKDILGNLWGSMNKDSLFVFPLNAAEPVPPTDVPQPLNTFTERIKINNPLVKKIPTVFILMTKDGKSSPDLDKLGMLRAKARKWKVFTFEGGHYSMREQPENLVKKLEEVMQQ